VRFSRLHRRSRPRSKHICFAARRSRSMGATGGCGLPSCFPTLFAKNAKRMGHGGLVLGGACLEATASPSTRPGARDSLRTTIS
jgi:hypothetical protein